MNSRTSSFPGRARGESRAGEGEESGVGEGELLSLLEGGEWVGERGRAMGMSEVGGDDEEVFWGVDRTIQLRDGGRGRG